MKFQAHRGVSTENPENTMESVRAAAEQGYRVAEIDVAVTSDGQFVLLHDSTINRTARMPDGSELTEETKISDISYEQALGYDLGVAFSRKFAGTKIPFLWDVLEFASRAGLRVKIDNKYEKFGAVDKERLFELVSRYPHTAELTCKTLSELEMAAKFLPANRFHYDGAVNEDIMESLSGILPRERLTVWVPLRNKRTAWANVGFATPALCEAVKRYAELGIWLLCDSAELAIAESLGADIVETEGQLKPPMNEGIVADMHTHSSHSHDCGVSLEEMRAAQAAKGTSLAAVTDHSDVGYYKTKDAFACVTDSVAEVNRLNARNDSTCRLLSGVEIGEGFYFPDKLRYVEGLCDYDVIIGSVHCTVKDGELAGYSRRNFSLESDEEVDIFMSDYFADVMRLIDTTDFDVLAHLTCPIRYVVGRHGKRVDMEKYDGVITDILKKIIQKGIALELNTSSISLAVGDFIPGESILAKYKSLGGYLITLGSDAHITSEASANFEVATKYLKKLGFENIFYYKKRRAHQCTLR